MITNPMLSAKEDEEFKRLFRRYVAAYGDRIEREPALWDQLEKAIVLWKEMEKLEQDLVAARGTGRKEYIKILKIYLDVLQKWDLLLTRMALTYTAQQYVRVDERQVTDPKEVLKINRKLKGFGKKLEKKARKRLNAGGARKAEDGPPIQWQKPIAKKKKKEKAKVAAKN